MAAIAIVLIVVILVVAVFVSLSFNNNSPKPTSTPFPSVTPNEATPAPTALATIDVLYHTTVINGVGNETPRSGYQFIMVDVTITNNGYSACQANSLVLQAVGSNGMGYFAYWSKYNREHTFNVNIANGETFNGSILISPPIGISVTGFGGYVEVLGKDLVVTGTRY